MKPRRPRATEPALCRAGCALALLLAGGLGLCSCAKEPSVATAYRWDPDIRPVFERACLPCHSRADSLRGPNAHGLNLERFERVRGARVKILETVCVERSMPGPNPAGIQLTEEEIRRIADWIRGGAPR